jgi:hypothetical protein
LLWKSGPDREGKKKGKRGLGDREGEGDLDGNFLACHANKGDLSVLVMWRKGGDLGKIKVQLEPSGN